MSSFAGIYRWKNHASNLQKDDEAIQKFHKSLSRMGDKVEAFRDNRLFLAKLDVGAYPDRALIIDMDGAAVAAGLPLLNPSIDKIPSRNSDLAEISRQLRNNYLDILRGCQGSYALCDYRSSDGRLTLAVDKLGIRPIYFHIAEDCLYFSTSLRVLEGIERIPKRMDAQGVAEMAAFGYPLSDRTPYADIKTLLNGESLTANDAGVRRSVYFRWDDIEPTKQKYEEFLEELYHEFVRAVACRSSYDCTAAALLSGGLDSRCIVTVLKNLGKDLFTASYVAEGYADGMYANRYAKIIESKHTCRAQPAMPSWNMWIQCLKNLEWTENGGPKFPKLIFSGEGGSGCMGFVLIEESSFHLMRRNRRDLAAQQFLENRVLPRRFMHREVYSSLQEGMISDVRAQLERIHSHDRGRDLQIFFLENHQRRHLYQFYECIDEHRVEFMLPFYDGKILEMTVSGPAEEFLRHRLYHQWLKFFPKEINAVPWQTYPGHEKCPVNNGLAARSQWETKWQDRYSGKSTEFYNRCREAVANPCFPANILDSKRVRLALALHRLRVRNFNYVFRTCALFHDYYAKCNGNVEFAS